MLVCNYFFSLFFSDSFFMGLVVGLMGRFSGALGVLVGVVLFTSGWLCFRRGGFVYIGVVLFSSGRQNGDMWHRYDAVLQQIAVMKQ